MLQPLWCNADLTPDAARILQHGIGERPLVMAGEPTESLFPGRPDPGMDGAEIALGQPDPHQILATQSVRWVHITSAGYTRYDFAEFWKGLASRGAILTNSSSVFSEPCAQHLLAFMLAQVRRLPESVQAQARGEWAYAALRPITRLIQHDRILLLGFGAIGRRVAELLQPFGCDIVGVRARPTGEEAVPCFPMSEAIRLAADADWVLNSLPASDATAHFVDRVFIEAMKPGAIYANVGRGATTHHDALRKALMEGRLGAAYLDVTDPEPVPAGHPLWSTPNCWITPHIAGGHANERDRLVDHFLRNYSRWQADEPLLDRVQPR